MITVPILGNMARSEDRDFSVVLSNPAGTHTPTVSNAIATVTLIAAPVKPTSPLASTGTETSDLGIAALFLIGAGAMIAFVRLRKTTR